MSRQRQWQVKKRAAGRCIVCGKPAAASKRKDTGGRSSRCLKHKREYSNYQREREGRPPIPERRDRHTGEGVPQGDRHYNTIITSEREAEVLRLFNEGLTNVEIGERLLMTEAAIRKIRRRLGVPAQKRGRRKARPKEV